MASAALSPALLPAAPDPLSTPPVHAPESASSPVSVKKVGLQGGANSSEQGRELLELHLHRIHKSLQFLARRSNLLDQEAEEFCSWALVRLIENDYRVLANWQGRSSFPTYLNAVLANLMRDYRIHLWGKWRPSAAARRLGSEAVLLERLWLRESLPLEEAIARVRREPNVALTRAELERMAARLPRRAERRQVGEEELLTFPVNGKVEARIEEAERARTAARLHTLLVSLYEQLPAEERRLLDLHYREGLSIARIASLLGRPQRELYSSRDRCLKRLRRQLEAAGLGAGDVCDLVGFLPGELLGHARSRAMSGQG